MKTRAWIIGAGLALALGASAIGAQPSLDRQVAGNTAFAMDLYFQLRGQEGNLFFSPYSISSALAMSYAGARGNTAAEMEKALHFTGGHQGTHPAFAALQDRLNQVQDAGHVELAVANSLWPQEGYPFLPEFLALVKIRYDAEIMPLDFAADTEGARKTINRWVEEETREKIRDLIAPGNLAPLVRLVLVNAIYFKGNWAKQFKPEQTAPGDFFVSSDTAVKVPMMAQTHRFPHAEFDDFQILQLPYEGNDLSMLVVLPRERGGLWRVEDRLTPEHLRQWRERLVEREVRVILPKFKMTWGASLLNGPLQALGMVDAFSETKADFSGMDGRPDWLYVGLVLHKAFVEVNEEGTEAAAATAVTMKTFARFDPPPEFRADHPFLFLIQEEETGSILFLGRVADPSKAE